MRGRASGRITRKRLRPSDPASIALMDVCARLGTNPRLLRIRDRRALLVEKRRKATLMLSEMGFDEYEIAGLLERDRTTILHHLNVGRNKMMTGALDASCLERGTVRLARELGTGGMVK